jgi:aminopeptidase N
MPDSSLDTSAASLSGPVAIHLSEYKPPAFAIDLIDLIFRLEEDETRVTSRLHLRRMTPATESTRPPLVLSGEALRLVSVTQDDRLLGPSDYVLTDTDLTISDVGDHCVLEIETALFPEKNFELSGLYKSGGAFCTQCEAEGFRRITYFLDRPDVLSRFTTTIVAERERYPVLLSNGNPVDHGESDGGRRHWAKWEDPHPKPAYLFALVAGDLIAVRDSFTTMSGRKVALAIWVRRGDEGKCGHAMQALKTSMRWDEEVFGLEYDLDVFNIVAVSDFNMGAMENKGLNIFNTKYILAEPATATDIDYQGIETVVAHEYFHNWTGNRVTCRDWFQLSLKEGLTVFRDQEFSADQGSRAVKRILDVRRLRAAQFPEDDGPLAHPVRPESYIEINNFYTATVYQKGAEVVRMIHTLIGAANFRRGMDLYIARHDNSAATIEDFVAAMQDASGIDLAAFKLWYSQAGTPEIVVEDLYDAGTREYFLTLRQSTRPTPGQPVKLPFVIPVLMGLLDENGMPLPTRLDGETEAREGTRLLTLTEQEQEFVFVDIPSKPIPSLLRAFSAPVRISGIDRDRRRVLAAHDPDQFARWDAGQAVATGLILDLVEAIRSARPVIVEDWFIEAISANLAQADDDPAFIAEVLTLPGETLLADCMDQIDTVAIHQARNIVREEIGTRLRTPLLSLFERYEDNGPYRIDGTAIGRRALRNFALGLLAAADPETGAELAKREIDAARNMTDVLAALLVLNDIDRPERAQALDQFHRRWRHDPLVSDKWFAIQAMSSLPGTIEAVHTLLRHADYDARNPNRVRSLIGSFSMANPYRFHDASGAGYDLLADQIIAIDSFNSQLASRMTVPLGTWRRHDAGRQSLMRSAIDRILAQPNLSKGCFEMASKSLA